MCQKDDEKERGEGKWKEKLRKEEREENLTCFYLLPLFNQGYC